METEILEILETAAIVVSGFMIKKYVFLEPDMETKKQRFFYSMWREKLAQLVSGEYAEQESAEIRKISALDNRIEKLSSLLSKVQESFNAVKNLQITVIKGFEMKAQSWLRKW